MRRLVLPCLLSLLALTPACDVGTSSSEMIVDYGALAPFYATSAPSGAQPVTAVRTSAKTGDEVVVRGRAKDFVEGRALVTIVDPSKPACDEAGPMDACPTPWDF